MATLPPTEDWRQASHTPLQRAHRTFVAPGYTTATDAINAVTAKFAIRYGSALSSPKITDPNMYVAMGGVSVKTLDGPTTWQVDVEYAYLANTYSTGQDGPPLERPTEWDITPGLDSVEVDADIFGNPIANSAGIPFPKRQKTIRTLFIRATRYYPNFSIATALKYMNKINASPVRIKSLGTVGWGAIKCTMIAPVGKIILDQLSPIQVVHEFEVRNVLVSGEAREPGFMLVEIDKGGSGWYMKGGKYCQGDFSIPDPKTVTDVLPYGTDYITKSGETLLNGDGYPIFSELDAGVRIGEGPTATVQQTIAPPPDRRLDTAQVMRQKGVGEAVRLLFQVEQEIDFGPLIAGL